MASAKASAAELTKSLRTTGCDAMGLQGSCAGRNSVLRVNEAFFENRRVTSDWAGLDEAAESGAGALIGTQVAARGPSIQAR